ncbi:uncharacterized protein LOC128317529 [Pangasianodon hypophthalmus]|uniref:uncharacterized protein LOC128317529 n=1 Tax=Pangasianodon hypophthalmus TaxID=310915 RepID=UPI0023082EE8|nr:uncharacterized protein LOC128317529 [Pangasianodon hypophthalmus]
MSSYCLSNLSLCIIPKAKTGMDHSSEISNITVIHTDLDHLETEEEEREESELADEVDEDIGMGGEDRTTGKQTSGNQISASDLQKKAKLAPLIVHVNPGEWGTKFMDNANDTEPKEMEAPNKDLDKEVEKELEQVSELQAEVESPVATEHRPQTELQTQNRPQSNAEFFSVTTREHKEQPCLSVYEHQSQVAKARAVEKQVEGKSEILCKDPKTRVSIKMEDKPKEHSEEGQCAEKIAEQELVASSKKVAHLKQVPPVVMQKEEVKPPKRCTFDQIETKVYSPDRTDWEISLYVKVLTHVTSKY